MIPIWELVSFSRNLSDVAVLSLNYLVPGTGTMVVHTGKCTNNPLLASSCGAIHKKSFP